MPVSQKFIKVCNICKAYCCSNIRPPVTKKEKDDIINAGFKDYFIKINNEIYEIKPGKNGKCPYLKKGFTCEIHKLKPILCKIWPVVPRLEKTEKKYLLIKCPIYKHLSNKELNEAKRETERIQNFLIEHLWTISPEIKNKFKIFDYEEI